MFISSYRTGVRSSSAPPAVFPLALSANGRYFQSPGGTPFFLKGAAAWNIHTQLSPADQTTFLDDCTAKGVNAIMVMLFDHFYTSHWPTDFQGNAPFNTPNDFATINSTYLSNFKTRILDACAAKGILVVLAPMYAGNESVAQGWAAQMRTNGSTKLRTLGSAIETAFSSCPNILYQHLGDNTSDLKDLAYSLAQGINDVTSTRLHTAHCDGGSGGDHSPRDVFTPAGSYPVMNTNLVYTYSGSVGNYMGDVCLTQWTRSPAWPFYKAEDRYFDDDNGSGGRVTAFQTRWQTYQAVFSGACGNFTGVNPIWYFGGVGNVAPTGGETWQTRLDAPARLQAHRAWQILTGFSWWASTPDSGNTFLTAGVSSGDDRAVAQLANDGSWAVAYTPSNRALTFDASKFNSTKTATWIDPTNGATTSAGSHANSGTWTITPSGTNAAGDGDWVIVFQ